MKKIQLIISILTVFIQFSLAQNYISPENFGIVEHNPTKSFIGMTDKELFKGLTGSTIPRNRYEEKIMNQLKRTQLTVQERNVLIKKDILQQPLTKQEELIYARASKKLEKRYSLYNKVKNDTSRLRSLSTPQLTPYEQELLQRFGDSTANLTKFDKRVLRHAQKKQKRIERKRRKYTLTDDEKLLLQEYNADTVKLPLSKRLKVRQVLLKVNRIEKQKALNAYARGDWVPVRIPLSDRFALQMQVSDFNKPSKYIKKLSHYEKRYELTPKEKSLINEAKSGYPLTLPQRMQLTHAKKKEEKYKRKVSRLQQKYFLELQSKQVRKQIRGEKITIKMRDTRNAMIYAAKKSFEFILSLF